MDRTGDYGTQFFGIGACMVTAGLLVIGLSATSLEQSYGVQQNTIQQQQQQAAAEQAGTAPDQDQSDSYDRLDAVTNQAIAEEE